VQGSEAIVFPGRARRKGSVRRAALPGNGERPAQRRPGG